MKHSLLALAVSAALGIAGAAQASDILTIDPDGAGALAPVAVATLDWNPGNAIATPYAMESNNVTDILEGDQIQVYSHARLANFLNADGDQVGAASPHEWTFVTGFVEEATSVTGDGAGATLLTTTVGGGSNFFEIWYQPAANSSNLAGTGFNDGTRILWGTVDEGGASAFSRNLETDVPDEGGVGNILDQANDNDYVGLDSINGDGSVTVRVTVDGFLASFFLDPIEALYINFTSQQSLAYRQVDPSALFTTAAGGGAPTQAGATLASISACNGCVEVYDGVQGGPNQVFQTDASNSFERVPEPATVALLGLGLAGLGFSTRRRKVS